jgi:drug/metabolite transporter (DMT)-like permease
MSQDPRAETPAVSVSSVAQARYDQWLAAMPTVFVLIWSTGFVVARFGMPHAPPLTFLAWRYAFSVLAFSLWLAWSRPAFPKQAIQWLHLAITGVLMHAGYLGGVWSAVKAGMSAGTSALIVGLQPLLTALWMSAFAMSGGHHRVTPRQWLGLFLGLAGLVLVVWHKMALGEASGFSLVCALVALLAITSGTLWQKRFVQPVDVRAGNTIQLGAAWLLTAPLSMLEAETAVWNVASMGAMAWSVLALTLGGSSLLMMLIQRGAATKVTSLMYLVPPCTAVLAWMLFDETLSGRVWLGMGLTAFAVWLVVQAPVKETGRG